MNDLILNDIKMTSLDLAEVTGKEHKNIIRDVKAEIEALSKDELKFEPIFFESNYQDTYGRIQPCYTFGRDGAMQLALKYDAVTRRKVIVKLKELESNRFQKLSPELQAIFSIDIKQQEHSERLTHLENNMTIDYGQERNLQVIANRVAIENMGGNKSAVYGDKSIRSRVFSHMWKDFKDYFNVASYRNTPKVEYKKAIEFLEGWKATGRMLREIEDTNLQMSWISE